MMPRQLSHEAFFGSTHDLPFLVVVPYSSLSADGKRIHPDMHMYIYFIIYHICFNVLEVEPPSYFIPLKHTHAKISPNINHPTHKQLRPS